MALSPWKRLTRLMLRRRPADQVQAQLSDNRDVSAEVIDTPDVAFASPLAVGAETPELEPIAALPDEILQPIEAEEAEPVEDGETAAELQAAMELPRENEPPAVHQVQPPGQPDQQPNEEQAKKARKPRRNTGNRRSWS
jgi:type IV secretory pathway VirB10-like protein